MKINHGMNFYLPFISWLSRSVLFPKLFPISLHFLYLFCTVMRCL